MKRGDKITTLGICSVGDFNYASPPATSAIPLAAAFISGNI